MAIVLPGKSDSLRVAVKIDSSINCTPDEYSQYLESLDESLLKVNPGEEPTWFVMRKVLPFALSKKVQNEQATMKDGEVQINISFMGEEVRCALIDIMNPAYVPVDQHIVHSKEKDGGTSYALMEQLVAADLVNDLYRARNASSKEKVEGMKKK